MLPNLRFSGMHLNIRIGPKTERIRVDDMEDVPVISKADLNQLCHDLINKYEWVAAEVDYYTPTGKASFRQEAEHQEDIPHTGQTFARVEIRDIHNTAKETDNADLDFFFQLQARGGQAERFRPMGNSSNSFFPDNFKKTDAGVYRFSRKPGTIEDIPARL